MNNLEWTGERLVTSLNDMHGIIEHLHRYALAKQISKDKIVLDIASGEGYGSFLLSKHSKQVYGVDIDEKSVEHAKRKYKDAGNLEYLCGSTSKIPLPDNSIDVVVSFETIEHHDEHDLMMQEISRVLKEDGCLLLSSPERDIYRQREPNNPFHIKELSFQELRVLIKKYFKYDRFFAQKFIVGSLIHSDTADAGAGFKLFDGNYTDIYEGLNEDKFYNMDCFNLVICSNVDIVSNGLPIASVFNGVNVIRKEEDDFKGQIQNAKNEKQNVLNSKSYKLGNWLVRKFTFRK